MVPLGMAAVSPITPYPGTLGPGPALRGANPLYNPLHAVPLALLQPVPAQHGGAGGGGGGEAALPALHHPVTPGDPQTGAELALHCFTFRGWGAVAGG